MTFPVDLSLLRDVSHMPAMPVLSRSMNRPDLQLHDFCIPVNSYFPTSELLNDLRRRLDDILRYYPSDNQAVSGMLAHALDLDAELVVVSNGSTELITWIYERFIKHDLVADVPTFGRWTDNARELGRVVHPFFRCPSTNFRIDVDDLLRFTHDHGAKALAICNPNNPTGAALSREELLHVVGELRHLDIIVVDESFVDFVSEDRTPTLAHDVMDFDNLIVLKSLGKNLGLHGLRCGYALACRQLASELRSMLPPWNVNALAEEFIRLLNSYRDEYDLGRRQTIRDSKAFASRLAQIDGLTVYPTNANFAYCELDDRIPGSEFRDVLLRQSGCFVRECGSKLGSCSQYLRIAARPHDQQLLLIAGLQRALTSMRPPKSIRRPAHRHAEQKIDSV